MRRLPGEDDKLDMHFIYNGLTMSIFLFFIPSIETFVMLHKVYSFSDNYILTRNILPELNKYIKLLIKAKINFDYEE